MELTPTERSLRSRLASFESWAKTADRAARTAPARTAQLARFAAKVDPDGTMTPTARAAAAEAAMRAHYTRMALASARSRRERSAKRATPSAGDAA